ncbi:alpha-beta hydrolase superfamily lysophospholipase [Sediminihabitans luteus]|uniref:Alpha-beta hydrolase superfamily lysophospholipase n=1 Tax=Sediminihabitans luteus TaxID=1138585 RepID=A0A2M9CE87_9CELL|nr:alpha/beta hydrolase [Sediminihabitans luteus]PJJ70256.1 alpha-beta hydrolase superfamily lysophospholipase [Sediminihabitans luteus]GII97727.1 lysophospholipase [Sediminihabitans luteus]
MTAARDGWVEDVLGPDYRRLTLELGADDEGDVVATLVRYEPPSDSPVRPARAVLYVHGWSDYFFQTGLAEYWHAQGAAFYALDLRKYGRSLRPHQTPGYVESLDEYDADIEAALAEIHAELGTHVRVMYVGHSTGGLTGVLWAARNPGRLSALVLNSPWIEMQGSAVVRTISTPAIRQLARFQPRAPLPSIDPGYYARTLHVDDGGEWTYDKTWRPSVSFPVRGGWLAAIIDGHAKVQAGLHIAEPIIVLLSSRTIITPRWSEDMRSADIVLDVDVLSRRAPSLGSTVTIARIPGGIHDLALSAPGPRARFYAEITRWAAGYGWG